jgi:hypothetical protein
MGEFFLQRVQIIVFFVNVGLFFEELLGFELWLKGLIEIDDWASRPILHCLNKILFSRRRRVTTSLTGPSFFRRFHFRWNLFSFSFFGL